MENISSITDQLKVYWTNFKNPEEFWKHEYYKHLSCAEEDHYINTEYKCFKMGLELREMINIFDMFQKNNIYPWDDGFLF